MTSKLNFLLIVFITLNLMSYGQSFECLIFEQALLQINHEWNKKKYVYTSPTKGNDPTNPIFIRQNITADERFDFYIVNGTKSFISSDIKYGFAELLEEKELLELNFVEYLHDINSCKFTLIDKYQFADYDSVLTFIENQYVDAKENSNIKHYTPARVYFSNILVNKNLVLLYAKVKIGAGSSPETIFGFIFEKRRNNWEVKKVRLRTI